MKAILQSPELQLTTPPNVAIIKSSFGYVDVSVARTAA